MNQMAHALRMAGVPVRKCFPKEQHASRGAAEAQIRSITNRDLEKSNIIHPYVCPFCKMWHVGHGDGRQA